MFRGWIRLVEAYGTQYDSHFDLSEVDQARIVELKAAGFDTEQVIYHGSQANFDKLDRQFLRTARHFYTSPDYDTARAYGPNVYACFGRQNPQADLTGDGVEGARLVQKMAETFADNFMDHVQDDEVLTSLKQSIVDEFMANEPDADTFDAEDAANEDPRVLALHHRLAVAYAADVISSGDERLYGAGGHFQNDLMAECFAMGYKSVHIFDASHTGHPISIIFDHGSDVVILGKAK